MQLVGSNREEYMTEVTNEAFGIYELDTSNVAGAIQALSCLKGIGPATASLLLSVHAPEEVIFFSDEVYYWLCCSGEKKPIKYKPKEYLELLKRSRVLINRLGVGAREVERVAFVIMRDLELYRAKLNSTGTDAKPENLTTKTKSKQNNEMETIPAVERVSKRAANVAIDAEAVPLHLRRSKRSKES